MVCTPTSVNRLDLSAAPPILYLFGLAAAGKSFVGDCLGHVSGRHVYHADDDLTEDMRWALANKAEFTEEMRDRFFEIVAQRIQELYALKGPLIVTQATYRQRHRDFLSARLAGLEFVLIRAQDDLIIQRLRGRGDQITPEYAATIQRNFEPPDPSCKVIENNAGKDEVLNQARTLYPCSS